MAVTFLKVAALQELQLHSAHIDYVNVLFSSQTSIYRLELWNRINNLKHGCHTDPLVYDALSLMFLAIPLVMFFSFLR